MKVPLKQWEEKGATPTEDYIKQKQAPQKSIGHQNWQKDTLLRLIDSSKGAVRYEVVKEQANILWPLVRHSSIPHKEHTTFCRINEHQAWDICNSKSGTQDTFPTTRQLLWLSHTVKCRGPLHRWMYTLFRHPYHTWTRQHITHICQQETYPNKLVPLLGQPNNLSAFNTLINGAKTEEHIKEPLKRYKLPNWALNRPKSENNHRHINNKKW